MPKPNFKIDEIMLVLIVAILAMAVSIYNKANGPNSPSVMEAEKITGLILDDHDISFATGGIVDEVKLSKIQFMDYKSFKNSLNAKNDFCIYLEDGNGNIILSKGYSKLSNDGIYCRE